MYNCQHRLNDDEFDTLLSSTKLKTRKEGVHETGESVCTDISFTPDLIIIPQ
jgi:hypothetical protein